MPATPFSANEQLRLHEGLARYISGLPTPLTGPTGAPYGPVWPLDTLPLARWRTHLITRLERHPYTYLYAPDPQTAADLITGEHLIRRSPPPRSCPAATNPPPLPPSPRRSTPR
ncbi:hypothetical protein AB0D60_18820 [Streptomyces sp. NPDC048306]|uniref:hypothetical protein n=1 Tax=Streptomyces sp. NPDC048306 TaxID=3154502 RepID=UPI0033C00E2B